MPSKRPALSVRCRLRLEPLHTVMAAAEHGSIRRAATALNTRQSTLSRQIRQLEAQLGVELFERTSGGVRITPAGVDLVRAGRRLFEHMDRMVSTARAVGRGDAGHIAIGLCTSLSASTLRAVIARYIQEFSEVEIEVIERSRVLLLDSLRNAHLDIVFVVGEAGKHDGPSMLLWSERIIVALPATHALVSREVIYWADLKGQSFLLSRRDPGPDLQSVIVRQLSAPGDSPVITSWDVSQESVLAMLESGRYISVHCESSAGFAYPGTIFREVRDTSGPCFITFTACWEQENSNPALARFLDLLRKHLPPSLVT